MKKYVFFALTGLAALCACENADVERTAAQSKEITFSVDGDFGSPRFRAPATRASLSADGSEMTDLWLFDYMDGQLVQQLHQSPSDADWGTPKMTLAYDSHHVYFVAARGDEPTVNTESHIIEWDIPRDAFWKDYAVDVTSTSTTSRSVVLDRVATKLRVTIKDEVPEACTQLSLTPSVWYYGLDYVNGLAVQSKEKERTVTVPASYAGTTGKLSMTIFGLSDTDEWTTDVALKALADDGTILGQVTITGAPFKRNRVTEYSGNLFGSGGGIDVSLNDTWEQSFTAEW